MGSQGPDAVALGEARVASSRVADFVAGVRTRLFELYVLLMSLGVGASICVYYHWTKKPREVRGLLRFWSRNFIYGARAITGTRWRLEGRETIPDRPVIFVGNHQAYWESIMMTVLEPHINVVTKRQAMSIPVFGWGLFHAPMTPVDRDSPGQNIRRIVREGKRFLAEGRSILIFPEGGRVAPGKHRAFSRGLELLYRECGAEVVPFVTNAGLHWPPGFETKHPGLITMRFLPSIAPGKDPVDFVNDLERLLNTEKDRLHEETLTRMK